MSVPYREVRCTLDDIKHIRQQVAGATVNDVSPAIVAEGLRRYLEAKGELPEKSLITCMPISTRRPGQTRSGSNQLTVSRISLHTNIADPMERLAAKAMLMTGSMPLSDGGAVLHCVGGYNGSFNFTFTACRELLPDSDFYRECLQAGIQAFLDAAGEAPPAARGNSRKKTRARETTGPRN